MEHNVNFLSLYASIDELETIFKSVYTLTKVKMTLYDSLHREVYAYPEAQSQFCALVRSQNLEYCRISDEYGFDLCVHSDGPITYYCHAGLIECIVPLKQNGEILGYIMFGQMLPSEDLSRNNAHICSKFSNLGTQDELQHALSALTVYNDAEIQAVTMLIQICISYLLSHGIVFTEKSQMLYQLNAYIDTHLDCDLTPEMISDYFNVSRTMLYSLSKRLLGCGIMSYVRQRRIEAAKALLVETTLPFSEIAYKVGFNDYNYFFRVFKQYTGVSCSVYRKNMANSGKESPK